LATDEDDTSESLSYEVCYQEAPLNCDPFVLLANTEKGETAYTITRTDPSKAMTSAVRSKDEKGNLSGSSFTETIGPLNVTVGTAFSLGETHSCFETGS